MDAGSQSDSETGGLDWLTAKEYLYTAHPGQELDEYLDVMAEVALANPSDVDTSLVLPILAQALDVTQSELVCRSIALAIAVIADPQDIQSVDALVKAYRRYQEHSFLAPALLETLGLLGLRNQLARAETISIILRLTLNDIPYLLIKGIQAIARLDSQERAQGLRPKLKELCRHEDLSVASEAYYQDALLSLFDVFMASDMGQLREILTATRAGFLRAEETAEIRPDARMYILLIDAILALEQLTYDPQHTTEQVSDIVGNLHRHLSQTSVDIWPDYRSTDAELMIVRCLSIADALREAASAITTADDWTNFDAALVDLATILTLAQANQGTVQKRERLETALDAVVPQVLLPKLGPLLERTVGRRRMSLVLEHHRDQHGDDGVTEQLVALEQALVKYESEASDQLEPLEKRLSALLGDIDPKVGNTIQELVVAIAQERSFPLPSTLAGNLPTLPIDQPDLFGGDPSVDDTIRNILPKVCCCLGTYDLPKWHRFQAVLEKIVSCVKHIRDMLPAYTLCAEDGGKGIKASEGDLQEELFRTLKIEFGRRASYEHTHIGGGRSDTGVGFPEIFFPIEVKHEFRSIERMHIRDNYLIQPDLYASATDRIAFLLILDLRHSNNAGHRKRSAQRKAGEGEGDSPVSLYHLAESFWVDSLPTDPQVPTASPNAIVVGLVPGNRPRPSSTTKYSKRTSVE